MGTPEEFLPWNILFAKPAFGFITTKAEPSTPVWTLYMLSSFKTASKWSVFLPIGLGFDSPESPMIVWGLIA